MATVDPDTGGIQFTPKNRKTPISFDGRRHIVIKKTPEQVVNDVSTTHSEEEVPVEPVSESEEEEEEDSDFEEESKTKKKPNKTKTKTASKSKPKENKASKRKTAPQSYKEDEEDSSKPFNERIQSPPKLALDIANDDWRSWGAVDY